MKATETMTMITINRIRKQINHPNRNDLFVEDKDNNKRELQTNSLQGADENNKSDS